MPAAQPDEDDVSTGTLPPTEVSLGLERVAAVLLTTGSAQRHTGIARACAFARRFIFLAHFFCDLAHPRQVVLVQWSQHRGQFGCTEDAFDRLDPVRTVDLVPLTLLPTFRQSASEGSECGDVLLRCEAGRVFGGGLLPEPPMRPLSVVLLAPRPHLRHM